MVFAPNGNALQARNELVLPDIGVKIRYPGQYTHAKNAEPNRRGSFVSYDFTNQDGSMPSLYEIQFFSKDSITQFAENCEEESPCFFGDYPDVERYNGQKNALQRNEDYQDYDVQTINGRPFLSRYIYDPNGSIYEYTTFIGDTKMDVWFSVTNEEQSAETDMLLRNVSIQEI